MAASNTKTAIYDTFTKGEFGVTLPSKAPSGSWTGQNVVVYRDGAIGPRPGLFRVPLEGEAYEEGVGVIRGLGFVPTAPDPVMEDSPNTFWWIIGDTVYLARVHEDSSPRTVIEADTTLDASPTRWVRWKESVRQIDGQAMFTNPDNTDHGYRLHMTTGVLTDVADMPGGIDLETYKERFVVVDVGPTPRIFYSAPADYNTWPVENFFDVGSSWPVIGVLEFRDGLCIWTNSGHWLLTGTFPEPTLRRVSEALIPQPRTLTGTNEDIFYIPNNRSAPISYTGSSGDEEVLGHLEEWKSGFGVQATGTMAYGNRDISFCSDEGTLLWRKNLSWSQHTFDPALAITAPHVRYFDRNLLLTDGGTEEVPPAFFVLNTGLEGPARESHQWARVGDDSDVPVDAWFSLPDFMAESGEEVRVRRVIVDFTKYDTGASLDNCITAEVRGIHRFEIPGVDTAVATWSWEEPLSEATQQGVYDRAVFRMGESGWAGGYRLTLKNLRGVSIHRILVDFETQDARPRS